MGANTSVLRDLAVHSRSDAVNTEDSTNNTTTDITTVDNANNNSHILVGNLRNSFAESHRFFWVNPSIENYQELVKKYEKLSELLSSEELEPFWNTVKEAHDEISAETLAPSAPISSAILFKTLGILAIVLISLTFIFFLLKPGISGLAVMTAGNNSLIASTAFENSSTPAVQLRASDSLVNDKIIAPSFFQQTIAKIKTLFLEQLFGTTNRRDYATGAVIYTIKGGGSAPTVTLNTPFNTSGSQSTSRVLNISISDPESDTMNVSIFGDNSSSASPLIAFFTNIGNTSSVTYNWSAPTINVSDNSLLTLYHFDTDASDAKGSNNGVVGGASLNRSGGRFGGAYDFDGSSNYINITPATGLGTKVARSSHTIAVWIKPNATGGRQIIEGDWNAAGGSASAALEEDSTNVFKYGVSSGGLTYATGTNTFSTGKWYFVVGRFNDTNNEVAIIVNGVKEATGTQSGTMDTGVATALGRGGLYASGLFFKGTLDEFALWNRTLTDDEIFNMYRLKNGTYYWKASITDGASTTNSGTQSFIIGNNAPQVPTLVSPVNLTVSSASSQKLNVTVSDNELDLLNISIYGINTSTPGPNNLIAYYPSISNGTTISFNWTLFPRSTTTDTGLVGLWHFDRDGFDSAGTSNATFNSSSFINATAGYYAGALSTTKVSGSDDFADIAHASNLNLTKNGSIEIWLYVSSYDNAAAPIIKADGGAISNMDYGLLFTNDQAGTMRALLSDGTNSNILSSTTAIALSRWTFLTMVWNDSTLLLYVDGQYNNSMTRTVNPSFTAGRSINVGKLEAGADDRGITGYTDEVAIYNKPLNSTDVSNHFKAGLSSSTYYWFVNVNESAGPFENVSGINRFLLGTAPSLTLNAPANASTATIAVNQFNFTPTAGTNALSNCTLYTNATGSFAVNGSTTTLTSGTNTNITIGLPNNAYTWNVQCTDATGFSAFATGNRTITLNVASGESVPPSYTGNWSNMTYDILGGDAVMFNITPIDDNPAQYVFSYDNGTGTFVNSTPASWTNNTKITLTNKINGTGAQTIRWFYYFNDTYSNVNQTQTFSFTKFSEITSCGEVTTNSIVTTALSTTATCLNLNTNGITLNCHGYALTGDGGTGDFGINITSVNNTFAHNCSISAFGEGVRMNNAVNNTVQNNTIAIGTSANTYGIRIISNSADNKIIANNISTGGTSGYAIYLNSDWNGTNISWNTITTSGARGYGLGNDGAYSGSFNVENNIITTSGSLSYGLYFQDAGITVRSNNITVTSIGNINDGIQSINSAHTTFTGNRINASGGNAIYIIGSNLQDLNYTFDMTNFAYGKPINFSFNANNLIIQNNNSFGQIIVAYSDNVTISNVSISSADGIQFYNVTNSTIVNASVSASNSHALLLSGGSVKNKIINNTFTPAISYAVGIQFLYDASSNNVTGNNITTSGASWSHPIWVNGAGVSNNIIANNTLTTTGVSGRGYIVNANFMGSGNTFNNNTMTSTVSNNNWDIGFSINSGSNNNFTRNTIKTSGNNAHGIYLVGGNFNNTFSYNIINTSSSSSNGFYSYGNISGTTFENDIFNVPLTQDILFLTGGNDLLNTVHFLNVSFNKTDVSLQSGYGLLNVSYYAVINVSSSTGAPISSANASVFDKNNSIWKSSLTPSNGLLSFAIPEFLIGANQTYPSNTTFYTPHTINTTASGYNSNSTTLNISRTNGTSVTILLSSANSAPSVPTLQFPADNASITNRTSAFNWTNSTDAEGDAVTYHLQIDTDSAFSAPTVNVSGIADGSTGTTQYLISPILNIDTTYYWRVRATDGSLTSAYTATRNFTVSSLLSITLLQSIVNFTSATLLNTSNTTGGSFTPFRLENNGNIFANISVTGTQLFTNGGFPNTTYQFKARANETNAFNTTASSTNWVNMTSSSTRKDIVDLNWSDINDDLLIDIGITVPSAEPPGTKTSNVTFSTL